MGFVSTNNRVVAQLDRAAVSYTEDFWVQAPAARPFYGNPVLTNTGISSDVWTRKGSIPTIFARVA